MVNFTANHANLFGDIFSDPASQTLEDHRTRTFQEEYLAFLKKHGAHFDEKYLWD